MKDLHQHTEEVLKEFREKFTNQSDMGKKVTIGVPIVVYPQNEKGEHGLITAEKLEEFIAKALNSRDTLIKELVEREKEGIDPVTEHHKGYLEALNNILTLLSTEGKPL